MFNAQTMEYVVIGRETCPETHKRDLQGYVVFTNGKRFTCVQKVVPGGRILSPLVAQWKRMLIFVVKIRISPTVRGKDVFRDVLVCAEKGDKGTIKDSYLYPL